MKAYLFLTYRTVLLILHQYLGGGGGVWREKGNILFQSSKLSEVLPLYDDWPWIS